MGKTLKLGSMLLIPALWLIELPAAHALQTIDASDGVTVEAVLSIKEPTRIRIDGAAITNVFGNLYSSNCGAGIAGPGSVGTTSAVPPTNPAGEIVLECDSDRGEVYVRPVGGSLKPVNLFISSARATYTLLLRRSDTPADTIVIRDKTARQGAPDTAAQSRAPVYVRSIKAMLVAMASDRVPADIRVDEVHRPIRLWAESQFSLTRVYEGRGLIGERYLLTNASEAAMVLAEQEFDRESDAVVAVAIANHNLRPGDTTTVYVIRQGS